MTDITKLTAKLKAAALAAGGEEWAPRDQTKNCGEYTVIVKGSLEKRSGWTRCRPVADEVVNKQTMKYIALANPAAVLELIAALEDAQRSHAVLATENAAARDAVQVFCDVVGDNTDAICEIIGKDGVMAILSAMRATGNLPATDAFPAEVRAQGVEAFAASLKVVGGKEHPYSVVAREFAAQLRQGGAA